MNGMRQYKIMYSKALIEEDEACDIQKHNEIGDVQGFNDDSDYTELFEIYSSARYGMAKINEIYISEIYSLDKCIIKVHHEDIDGFINFFLNKKMVLTETCFGDKKNKNFLKYIRKKNKNLTEMFDEDGDFFYLFFNIDINVVTMNNGNKLYVPQF